MVMLIFNIRLAIFKYQIQYEMKLFWLEKKEIINYQEITLNQLSLVKCPRSAKVKTKTQSLSCLNYCKVAKFCPTMLFCIMYPSNKRIPDSIPTTNPSAFF